MSVGTVWAAHQVLSQISSFARLCQAHRPRVECRLESGLWVFLLTLHPEEASGALE